MRVLEEEERSDAELRNQMKERWTRTPSPQLTMPLRDEAKGNIEKIQKAMKSDEIVKAKYNQYRDGILLLSKHPVCIQEKKKRQHSFETIDMTQINNILFTISLLNLYTSLDDYQLDCSFSKQHTRISLFIDVCLFSMKSLVHCPQLQQLALYETPSLFEIFSV